MQPIVTIDAGHYGKYNRSPVVPEFYESEMNWKLAQLLQEELEEYPITVRQTRADPNKDLNEYDRGIDSEGSAFMISLHANWAQNTATDYPLSCCQISGKTDAIGLTLAQAVEKVMGTSQYGRIYKRTGNRGDYYGVLRGAAAVGVPAVILEHSFYTNEAAARWLLDANNLAKLAEAEAQVIADYLGVKKAASGPKPYDLTGIPQVYRGVKSEFVKSVQTLLKERGYYTGEIDGSFGPATEKAAKAFQSDMGLNVDGYVGRGTMTALLRL